MDFWVLLTALSPPVSGRSSPILVEDDSPLFTVVDEVGEKSEQEEENTTREKVNQCYS